MLEQIKRKHLKGRLELSPKGHLTFRTEPVVVTQTVIANSEVRNLVMHSENQDSVQSREHWYSLEFLKCSEFSWRQNTTWC